MPSSGVTLRYRNIVSSAVVYFSDILPSYSQIFIVYKNLNIDVYKKEL